MSLKQLTLSLISALSLAVVLACSGADTPPPAAPAPAEPTVNTGDETPVETPAEDPAAEPVEQGESATADDATEPGDCVSDCVTANQMRAVAAEMIQADCEKQCAGGE